MRWCFSNNVCYAPSNIEQWATYLQRAMACEVRPTYPSTERDNRTKQTQTLKYCITLMHIQIHWINLFCKDLFSISDFDISLHDNWIRHLQSWFQTAAVSLSRARMRGHFQNSFRLLVRGTHSFRAPPSGTNTHNRTHPIKTFSWIFFSRWFFKRWY